MANVLVIDDDASLLTVAETFVRKAGYHPIACGSGEAGLDAARAFRPDAALIDVRLPGIDGAATARLLRLDHPALPVLLMSGFPLEGEAAHAVAGGQFGFLQKPVRWSAITAWIDRVLPAGDGGRSVERGAEPRIDQYPEILGESAPMRTVLAAMTRIAPISAPVLILGETGTGKELVARALHRTSPRRAGPFVAVNCGAVPGTLFEAECFGHERGAFTDAQARHSGWFEQANHGTLFLDEVGEMPVESQVKLLRVLEQQEVMRLGGEHPIRVDVRVIAATNADLQHAPGRFRGDLYYRLAGRVMRLPPLRDRPGDVTIVARRMLGELSRVAGGNVVFSPEALRAMERHPWPGNVRELEHTIGQALADAEGGVIRESDLPLRVSEPAQRPKTDHVVRPPGLSLTESVRAAADHLERRWIVEALEAAGGSRTEAARLLGIDRKTLFDKTRKYTIDF